MKEIWKFGAKPKQGEADIKLDECLTLKMVKKLQHGGYIKKILNVPNFKVYFLEEKPISAKDDKLLIKQELDKWNACPPNTYQLKNMGLHWNTPEQFLSLLEEYTSGCTLEDILHSVGYLPEQAMVEKLV